MLLPVIGGSWFSHAWGQCTLPGVEVMKLCKKRAAAVGEGRQRTCDDTPGYLKINAYVRERSVKFP